MGRTTMARSVDLMEPDDSDSRRPGRRRSRCTCLPRRREWGSRRLVLKLDGAVVAGVVAVAAAGHAIGQARARINLRRADDDVARLAGLRVAHRVAGGQLQGRRGAHGRAQGVAAVLLVAEIAVVSRVEVEHGLRMPSSPSSIFAGTMASRGHAS